MASQLLNAGDQKRLAFNQSLHAKDQSWNAKDQIRKNAIQLLNTDNQNR